LVSLAGFNNQATISGIEGWKKVSMEALIQMNPDWIVASSAPSERERFIKKIKQQNGWRHVNAVRKNRFKWLSSPYLVSVSHTMLEGARRLCVQ
jgi:ABC-type Fe3+-hydroxamate transport system substrate-binding protein